MEEKEKVVELGPSEGAIKKMFNSIVKKVEAQNPYVEKAKTVKEKEQDEN